MRLKPFIKEKTVFGFSRIIKRARDKRSQYERLLIN
jgi:hypothetical protein